MAHRPENIYRVNPAQGASTPLVIDSPHSGRDYPDDFDYACDFEYLQKHEDRFVDLLVEGAARKHNVPFLAALFPRTYIDPNRAEDDISPDILSTPWPHTPNPTARSLAGHGLIRQTLGPDRTPLYHCPLSAEEVIGRLDHYYRPYHGALADLLENALFHHGAYVHLSFHSMPDSALQPYYVGRTPDFVLGDLDGTSCDLAMRRDIQGVLVGLGYQVAVNVPYKGAEIVRRYGNPSQGRNSLQIEINRSLYLDKSNRIYELKFNQLIENIDKLIGFCVRRSRTLMTSPAAN